MQALVAPPDQVAPGEFLVVAAIEVLVLVRQLPGPGPRLVDRLVRVEEAVANGRAQRHPRQGLADRGRLMPIVGVAPGVH